MTWSTGLIIANVIAYFLQQTQNWITPTFWFLPAWAFERPWTVVTYMFLHGDLMHLLFNMLGLFFFGGQVEDRLGPRRFATMYFLSGIAGAIASFIFAPRNPIIGASAGVFGVMFCFAYYWPNAPIMIWGIVPVPAKWLVIGTTLLSLWSGFGGVSGGVAHFAHLGGYAGAYLYLKWTQRSQVAFKKRAEGAHVLKGRFGTKPPAIDMKKVHPLNQEELNRILDKISAEGMGSLTPAERTFLSNFVPPDDRPTVQ
jgi:membrane associated rhomboid family serine protease